MANTGIVEGQDMLIYISEDDGATYDAIAHATSHTMVINTETRQRNTKDTGKWDAKKAGLLSWSMTSESLLAYDSFSFNDLLAAQKLRVPVKVKYAGRPAVDSNDDWTPEVAADSFEEGMAIIESVTRNDAKNADSTMSISLVNDGELATHTVPV
ncbi:hypothetical protein KAH94_02890 [bacterium]|nr:hypothetical protein [bacterium]